MSSVGAVYVEALFDVPCRSVWCIQFGWFGHSVPLLQVNPATFSSVLIRGLYPVKEASSPVCNSVTEAIALEPIK